MNDPLALTNGFMINRDGIEARERKTCFQLNHSDSLSKPKK